MKILVLGATGMIGNTIFRCLSRESEHKVWGTYRKSAGIEGFLSRYQSRLYGNVDVLEQLDKFSLLMLVAKIYGKNIMLIPDNTLKINRSLDSSMFRAKTGYVPPSWENMIADMYNDYMNEDCYIKKPGADNVQ